MNVELKGNLILDVILLWLMIYDTLRLSLGIIPEDLLSAPEADPIWNLNLVFAKSTTITYGPWADKQRYLSRTSIIFL